MGALRGQCIYVQSIYAIYKYSYIGIYGIYLESQRTSEHGYFSTCFWFGSPNPCTSATTESGPGTPGPVVCGSGLRNSERGRGGTATATSCIPLLSILFTFLASWLPQTCQRRVMYHFTVRSVTSRSAHLAKRRQLLEVPRLLDSWANRSGSASQGCSRIA